MSELEYRSGIASVIDIPDNLSLSETIAFLSDIVGVEPEWMDADADGWQNAFWFNKSKLEELVFVRNKWYHIKYQDYDNGHIHMAHRTVTNDIVFAFCCYNGGTWFGSEFEEAIKKLDKVQ